MTDTTPDHYALKHKKECMQTLLELVQLILSNNPDKAMPAGFDAAGWLAEWVEKEHPRLNNDRPSDMFDSQDGFEDVVWLLSSTIRDMLHPS